MPSLNKIDLNLDGEVDITTLACTRNDIDPCAYFTNGSFAAALVSELNSVIMGCPPPQECSPQCCQSYNDFSYHNAFNIGGNSINPWLYCCSRTNCSAYDCGNVGYMCNYADQAVQDSMINRARAIALTYRPMCGNIKALIKNISFYVNQITDDCTLDGCYNCEIYFRVYYYSCTCTEE